MNARIQLNWWGRILAGTVLGFTLALAVAGVFQWGMPPGLAKFQFVMWLVVPVWLGVLSAVFLFRDVGRAWLWLGGANVAAYALMFLLRSLAR